jgi:hypothetical protein
MSLESNGGMILTGKNRRTQRKACPSMQFLLITQLQYLRKNKFIDFTQTTLAKMLLPSLKTSGIKIKKKASNHCVICCMSHDVQN